jgi:hypothetical protein
MSDTMNDWNSEDAIKARVQAVKQADAVFVEVVGKYEVHTVQISKAEAVRLLTRKPYGGYVVTDGTLDSGKVCAFIGAQVGK